MKNSIKLFLIFLVIPAFTFLESCQIDDEVNDPPANTFYGKTVPVGHGVARAWVSVDRDGDPTAVGINFSEKALEDLPDEHAQYVLPLPENKGMGFYTHATLEWNPEGHEPPGTYDLEHFDFHFYIIPEADRLAFGPDDEAEFANAPDAKYVPSDFMQIPGGVPQMGAHWADLLSPEFSGEVFTKTFIWGSYDGEFIFWEPMVSLDYLLTHPDDLVNLRQPEAFQRNGWYPTKYKVAYSTSPKEFTVALMNLRFHVGE